MRDRLRIASPIPGVLEAAPSSSTAPAGSSASVAATASTASIISPGAGLIDIDGTTLEVLAVQAGDCSLGSGLGRHFNESESARITAEFIANHIGGCHLTEHRKRLLEILIGNITRQISYKDIHVSSI